MVGSGYSPVKKLMMILDIMLTISAFVLAYIIRGSYLFHHRESLFSFQQYLWVFWIIVPTWPLIIKQFGLYNGTMHSRLSVLFLSVVKAVLIGSLIIASAIYAVKDDLFSRAFFGLFIGIDFILLLAEKLIIRAVFYGKKSHYNDRRVIIVSGPEGVSKFVSQAARIDDININIQGYFTVTDSCEEADGVQCLGTMDDINRYVINHAVDEVIFVLPKDYISEIENYIVDFEEMGITVSMLLDIYDLKLAKTDVSYLGHIPMLTFHTVCLTDNQILIKRIIDLVGAFVGLVITAFLYVVFAPLIKLESKGPVIFGQTRVGENGRTFRCYKFRTMYDDAEDKKQELEHLNVMKGAMFKIENDPRITKIGRIIRKFSLDEFPQFYNVLKGEMSLVGTRPPLVEEVEQYEKRHRRRLSIKPGITGLWQVSGRNEITDFDEIVKLDVEYIDNWSLWLDIKILLMTLGAVFSRTGM